MERSLGGIKSKAYLIIVGAFIIGVVTGSLLMNLVVAKAPPLQKPPLIDELTGELQLSVEHSLATLNVRTNRGSDRWISG